MPQIIPCIVNFLLGSDGNRYVLKIESIDNVSNEDLMFNVVNELEHFIQAYKNERLLKFDRKTPHVSGPNKITEFLIKEKEGQ